MSTKEHVTREQRIISTNELTLMSFREQGMLSNKEQMLMSVRKQGMASTKVQMLMSPVNGGRCYRGENDDVYQGTGGYVYQ